MKNRLIFVHAATAILMMAQDAPLPPPNPPAPPSGFTSESSLTRKGTIKAFNSGPAGETNGVILRDDTTVFFPPEIAGQIRSFAKSGATLSVTGVNRTGPEGQVVIDARTIAANGQTIVVAAAAPPPPPPPPGRRPRGPRRAPPPPSPDGVNPPPPPPER